MEYVVMQLKMKLTKQTQHVFVILLIHFILTSNCMTISNYNTKPILRDRAIIFLKLHGFT